MNETRVYADGFHTTFANAGEMLEFLAERTKTTKWIRKPTKSLRLVPLEKESEQFEETKVADMEEILEDTDRNTQLVLKIRGESYPVRSCAIKTILDRARINGNGLRDLEKSNYAKVVNCCLRVAKGEALIKIADGKVSAVHGGDAGDYEVLNMQEVFELTMQYLNLNFPGTTYMEGSGTYDHLIVSAMWELGGNQKLLDTYRQALEDHGLEDQSLAPALRLTTSDVAESGVNLFPMLLCKTGNRTISLGSPLRLSHRVKADAANLALFHNNLKMICSRYTDAITDMTKLMDIEVRNPLNCLRLVMKKVGIKKKIINEVAQLFEAQNGNVPCTAHDLYYAINEASFFAACDGMQGHDIISLEENITRALALDWTEYDVPGAIKW